MDLIMEKKRASIISNAWFIAGPVIFLLLFFGIPLFVVVFLVVFDVKLSRSMEETLGILVYGLGMTGILVLFVAPFVIIFYLLKKDRKTM